VNKQQFNLLLALKESDSGFLAKVLSFFLDIAQGILSACCAAVCICRLTCCMYFTPIKLAKTPEIEIEAYEKKLIGSGIIKSITENTKHNSNSIHFIF
jgi:hypothetical protein